MAATPTIVESVQRFSSDEPLRFGVMIALFFGIALSSGYVGGAVLAGSPLDRSLTDILFFGVVVPTMLLSVLVLTSSLDSSSD